MTVSNTFDDEPVAGVVLPASSCVIFCFYSTENVFRFHDLERVVLSHLLTCVPVVDGPGTAVEATPEVVD